MYKQTCSLGQTSWQLQTTSPTAGCQPSTNTFSFAPADSCVFASARDSASLAEHLINFFLSSLSFSHSLLCSFLQLSSSRASSFPSRPSHARSIYSLSRLSEYRPRCNPLRDIPPSRLQRRYPIPFEIPSSVGCRA